MTSIYDERDRIEKAQGERASQDRRDLREILNTTAGRRRMYKTFEESYIFTTTFTRSSQGFFNEGQRALALKDFNAVLDLDPHIFAKMCEEFRDKEE